MSDIGKLIRIDSSPASLARGCAWGVLLGLVPKTNLTAVMILFLILTKRVNLVAAFLSAGLAALLALQIEPLLHWVGQAVLTFRPLQTVYDRLFQLPLIPWTALDNTVTAGAVCIGCLLHYPIRRVLELRLAISRRQERPLLPSETAHTLRVS